MDEGSIGKKLNQEASKSIRRTSVYLPSQEDQIAMQILIEEKKEKNEIDRIGTLMHFLDEDKFKRKIENLNNPILMKSINEIKDIEKQKKILFLKYNPLIKAKMSPLQIQASKFITFDQSQFDYAQIEGSYAQQMISNPQVYGGESGTLSDKILSTFFSIIKSLQSLELMQFQDDMKVKLMNLAQEISERNSVDLNIFCKEFLKKILYMIDYTEKMLIRINRDSSYILALQNLVKEFGNIIFQGGTSLKTQLKKSNLEAISKKKKDKELEEMKEEGLNSKKFIINKSLKVLKKASQGLPEITSSKKKLISQKTYNLIEEQSNKNQEDFIKYICEYFPPIQILYEAYSKQKFQVSNKISELIDKANRGERNENRNTKSKLFVDYEQITLPSSDVKDFEILYICLNFFHFKTLKVLNFENNQIKDKAGCLITTLVFQFSPLVKYINFKNTEISTHTLAALSKLLDSPKRNIPLFLNIGNNKFEEKDLIKFFVAISKSSTISSLDLENTELNSVSGQVLSGVLRYHNSLRIVSISKNLLPEATRSLIFGSLGNNHKIQVVSLASMSLTDSDVQTVLHAFTYHKSICEINLSCNLISDRSCVQIGTLFSKCKKLVHINLEGNPTTKKGIDLLRPLREKLQVGLITLAEYNKMIDEE